MTWADLAVMDVAGMLEMALPGEAMPDKLKCIAEQVKADPKIAAYHAARK